MATELLESADLQTSFVILSRLRHLVGANHLEQLFKIEGSVSRFQQFLDMVERRHGENGAIFKPIFDRMAAIDEIVNRRSFVTDPEHRFFMALLMNVDDRSRIFDLIKQRFPGAEPVEKILDWVFDLADTRVVGVETSNALGIPNFGDAEMFVLENMLYGKADGEILSAFSAENGGADASEAIAKIRKAAIFRPLVS